MSCESYDTETKCSKRQTPKPKENTNITQRALQRETLKNKTSHPPSAPDNAQIVKQQQWTQCVKRMLWCKTHRKTSINENNQTNNVHENDNSRSKQQNQQQNTDNGPEPFGHWTRDYTTQVKETCGAKVMTQKLVVEQRTAYTTHAQNTQTSYNEPKNERIIKGKTTPQCRSRNSAQQKHNNKENSAWKENYDTTTYCSRTKQHTQRLDDRNKAQETKWNLWRTQPGTPSPNSANT